MSPTDFVRPLLFTCLAGTLTLLGPCGCASAKSIELTSPGYRSTDLVKRCKVVPQHNTLAVTTTTQWGVSHETMDGAKWATKLSTDIVAALKTAHIDAVLFDPAGENKNDGSFDTLILVQMIGFQNRTLPSGYTFKITVMRPSEHRTVSTGNIETRGDWFVSWEKPARQIVARLIDENGYLKK